jgi:hypothetical protein
MQLNNAALGRLAAAKFNAETTVALLGLLAAQADVLGSTSGVLTLDYHQPGDPIEPGDLIPVLTFSLRPYHLHELQEYEATLPPQEAVQQPGAAGKDCEQQRSATNKGLQP